MKYNYSKISDYFKLIDFAYIATFSFNRGRVFDKLVSNLEYTEKDIHGTYLINGSGEFNRTSERVAIIKRNSEEFSALKKITSGDVNHIPTWMCAPIFRDALVFYSSDNKVLDVLNICFTCEQMENSNHVIVEADKTMYKDLAIWFKRLGHVIDENETEKLYMRLRELKKQKV